MIPWLKHWFTEWERNKCSKQIAGWQISKWLADSDTDSQIQTLISLIKTRENLSLHQKSPRYCSAEPERKDSHSWAKWFTEPSTESLIERGVISWFKHWFIQRQKFSLHQNFTDSNTDSIICWVKHKQEWISVMTKSIHLTERFAYGDTD